MTTAKLDHDTLILTTDHPASSYGVPVLVCTDPEDSWVKGPADEFPQATYDRRVCCAEPVSAWARASHRTAAERSLADAFCRAYPDGPQVGRDIETGALI